MDRGNESAGARVVAGRGFKWAFLQGARPPFRIYAFRGVDAVLPKRIYDGLWTGV